MLENEISTLVSENRCNIAVDISPLDYIYSDSINKIMNINRKILDANGRFALLSPQEETQKVLQRSGITNFIKIYSSEDELARSSEEILKKTTSFSTDELKKAGPKSEFEDLRSEIGQAFVGDSEPGQQEQSYEEVELEKEVPPPPPRQPQEDQHTYPPPPSATEDYFGPQSTAGAPDMSGPAQGSQQPFQQQEQQGTPASGIRGAPDSGTGEESYFAPPQPPPPPPQEDFAPQPQEPQPAPVSREDDDLRHKDIFEEEEKKGFPVGIFIVGLVAIGLIAGIVTLYFVYFEPASFLSRDKPAEEKTIEAPQLEEKDVVEETVGEEEEGKQEPEESVEKNQAPASRQTTARPSRKSRIRVKRSPKPEREASVSRTPPSKESSYFEPSTPSREEKSAAVEKKEPPRRQAVSGTPRPSSSQPRSEPSTPAVSEEPEKSAPSRAAVSPEPSRPAVKKEPAPQPSKPAVSQAPASSAPTGEPATVFIATFPPMADVYMDGKKIGKGNVDELKVRSGTHTIKFVKGAKEITKTMTFTPGKNASKVVKLP